MVKRGGEEVCAPTHSTKHSAGKRLQRGKILKRTENYVGTNVFTPNVCRNGGKADLFVLTSASAEPFKEEGATNANRLQGNYLTQKTHGKSKGLGKDCKIPLCQNVHVAVSSRTGPGSAKKNGATGTYAVDWSSSSARENNGADHRKRSFKANEVNVKRLSIAGVPIKKKEGPGENSHRDLQPHFG